jgi:integrase
MAHQDNRITAHVLRHTTVMRLLHAGINTIDLHADLEIK